ncbi:MAG: family 43 glycosylhydrolase [Janthinobacterium lividum]
MNTLIHSLVRPLRAWAGRLLLALAIFSGPQAFALQGLPGAHDPSTIVKRNGVYHVWATGDQVYHLTSTDLVNWTPAATVFAAGTWPGWINTYVAGFKGNFWAPECVFMNGKYYLYYSCSLGQRPCAIGVATSTDLTTWTDQGMVVYSDNATPYGCIDPAVFTDAQGKAWMAFGSHLSGNWLVQLDPATGKRLDANIKNIAGASPYCENEASYVMQHGGYYYLFYNKGICCAGVTSTYYVQMGRSLAPGGPYLDKNGVDLLQGGGSDFLVGQSNYVGPGQVGLFIENGVNYLTYHYYNARANGAPTLGIGSLGWDAATGWPAATQDWLAAGTYTVANQNSGKLWAAAGCTAAAGQALVQSAATGQPCQQWQFAPQGSGVYKITNVGSNLAVDVAGCAETAGTALALQAASPQNCQSFRVERAADGTLVLSSIFGNRVVEVPNAALADGQPLGLWDYNGCNCQHWTISAIGTVTATRSSQNPAIQVFPNPATGGNFSVQLPVGTVATVTVIDLAGRVVYRREVTAGGACDLPAGLGTGTYAVQIATAGAVATRKLVVLR